jgi:hypothetical protein
MRYASANNPDLTTDTILKGFPRRMYRKPAISLPKSLSHFMPKYSSTLQRVPCVNSDEDVNRMLEYGIINKPASDVPISISVEGHHS